MNTRTRTLATLFTLAMAAMLLGAAVTTQMRPVAALARTAEPEPAAAMQRSGGGAVTLDTFRDVARAYTAGVVNINTSKEVRSSRGRRDPFHEFFGDDFMERFFGPGQSPERQTQRTATADLLGRLFGGSAAALMQQALSVTPSSREELKRIREMLDAIERGETSDND